METDEVEVGNLDSLESRARLMSSDRYKTIMDVSQFQFIVFLPALSALFRAQAVTTSAIRTAGIIGPARQVRRDRVSLHSIWGHLRHTLQSI